MNWQIQTYITDTTEYMVFRQGDSCWKLLFNGKVLTDFPDERSAIAYAETLNQRATIGSPK